MQIAKKNKYLILSLLTKLRSKNMEIMFLNMEIYITQITNKKSHFRSSYKCSLYLIPVLRAIKIQ